MFTIYTSSLLIGIFIGFAIGVGVLGFATWVVDKSSPSEFNSGWDAGCKYGRQDEQMRQKQKEEALLTKLDPKERRNIL